MFADVRTCWNSESVKRVTGYDLEGKAKDANGIIHLINSGACCLDACGQVKDENIRGITFTGPRKDVEKILTEEQFEKINEAVSKYYEDKIITDTHLGDIQIYCDIREKTVEDKLNEFRHAKLVVTDRLHGMIFAAITSTPCIVLGNYNHKIESSYDWLKEQGYIKFVKNVDEIEEKIKAIKNNNKKYCYNNEFAIKQYQKIIDLIRE